jgi:hypothetical protein
MLNGEVAKYQIDDRIRAGERYRVGRASASRRSERRKTVARRLIATTAALLPIPIKH